jgi:hypothetical protein
MGTLQYTARPRTTKGFETPSDITFHTRFSSPIHLGGGPVHAGALASANADGTEYASTSICIVAEDSGVPFVPCLQPCDRLTARNTG